MVGRKMSERSGILAGGNWIIDHVKIIDFYPAQDTLANISEQSAGTGGCPYNVLTDLSKLGAPFPLNGVGLVGDDADGHRILDGCETSGIDVSQIQTTRDAATSYTDVMTVASTGRRTFFHQRGTNALLNESHFNLGDSQAKIFLLGYLLLLDELDKVDKSGQTGASRLFRTAKEKGFKTVADLVSEDSDRFIEVVKPSLPELDYLIINEFEAHKLTGVEIVKDETISFEKMSEAAEKLFQLGVSEWVVLHCPKGALARNHHGETFRQGRVALPDEKIAGTAGAGDCFASGILLGLHEGWDMERCLRLAACAASSSLHDPTCTGGVLSMEESFKLGEIYSFETI